MERESPFAELSSFDGIGFGLGSFFFSMEMDLKPVWLMG